MSLTKQINITSKDYSNLEKIFYNYLKHNQGPEDNSALKTIQSIINQSID